MTKQKALVVWVILLTLITAANTGGSFLNAKGISHNVGRIKQSTVVNCEEIELVKTALRATIEQARTFTRTSKVRSHQEKAASEAYYTSVLTKFSARDCKKSIFKPKGNHARAISKATHNQHRDKAVLHHK